MAAEGPIAAVVLAAGASRRFGAANKLLSQVRGRPLVAGVVDAVADAGSRPVVVVTGWDRAGIESALSGREVQLVHNAAWESGMGSSIAAGIEAVGAASRAALIVPGDMALLTSELVAALTEAFDAAGGERIVFPVTCAGEQRNPVLWPRRYFSALRQLPPQAGAKSLLAEVSADCMHVLVDDDAVLGDIDTPGDLQRALSVSRV